MQQANDDLSGELTGRWAAVMQPRDVRGGGQLGLDPREVVGGRRAAEELLTR